MEITDEHGVDLRPEDAAKKLLEDMDADVCNGGDVNCPTCGHNGATVRRVTEAFLSLYSVVDEGLLERIADMQARIAALDDECKNWHTQYLRLLTGEQR